MAWIRGVPRVLAAAFVVVVVAVGCGAGGPEVGRTTDGSGAVVAHGLPEGAIVVVSGRAVDSLWSKFEATQLVSELRSIDGVAEAFQPLAASREKFREQTGLSLDRGTVMGILGESFDIGVYGALDDDRTDVVVVASVRDEPGARSLMEAVEERLARDEGVTFQDAEYTGVAVRVGVQDDGHEVLFYALSDGRLTAATTAERIEQAIALGGNGGGASMAGSEPYSSVMERLPGVSLVLYVDQAAVRNAAARAAGAGGGAAARDQIAAAGAAFEGFDIASAMGVGAGWGERGLVVDMYLRFPEASASPLIAMLRREPGPIGTVEIHPATTFLYSGVAGFDAPVVYAEILRYTVEATRIRLGVAGTPDSLVADSLVAREVAQLESELGIEIERGLVAWMGDEWSFAIAGIDRTGFFPVPELAVVVEVTDADRALAAMGSLELVASGLVLDQLSIPLSWQSESYEGTTIRYAPTPMGDGLSLSYAIVDPYLVVATSRGVVKRMLDARDGRAEGLAANPDFEAIREFLPKQANAMGFVNIRDIVTEVQGLLSTFGAGADTLSSGHRTMEALKHVPRIGFYTEADEDGLKSHTLVEIE